MSNFSANPCGPTILARRCLGHLDLENDLPRSDIHHIFRFKDHDSLLASTNVFAIFSFLLAVSGGSFEQLHRLERDANILVPRIRTNQGTRVLGAGLYGNGDFFALEFAHVSGCSSYLPVRTVRRSKQQDWPDVGGIGVGAYEEPGEKEECPVMHVLVVRVRLAVRRGRCCPRLHSLTGRRRARGRGTIVLLLASIRLPALVGRVTPVHVSDCDWETDGMFSTNEAEALPSRKKVKLAGWRKK